MDKPIGVFDSGIGGLTVLKEIKSILPKEDIIYFGDIARSPYGSKSESLVIKYAHQALLFLLSQDVKLVVVACNTASAVARGSLSSRFQRIVDVIEPAISSAIKLGKRVGIIGTKRTISSEIYQKRITREGLDVIVKPCPLFVPLVEEGWIDNDIVRLIAKEYLLELKGKIDILILACTHYPFLIKIIEEVMGDNLHIINSATETAISVKTLLEKEGLLNRKGGRLKITMSDYPGDFMRKALDFLKMPPVDIERIDLEEYEGSISRKV